MTKEEALKLVQDALGALENISIALREEDVLGSDIELMLNTISKIHTALAQPEQDAAAFIAAEDRKVASRYGYVPKLHPSEWQDVQPAQEPVAWMCSDFDGDTCEQTNHDECENPIPLYTTPPQRPWVGLTHEEHMEIMTGTITTSSRMAAVEAKLKEKNT